MMRRRSQVYLGLSLVFVIGLVVLYAWGRQPAEGRLVAGIVQPDVVSQLDEDRPAKVAVTEPAVPEAWSTKFFNTMRPAGFELRTSREDAQKASYNLVGRNGGQTNQCTIIVDKLAGSLQEVSAIKLRQSQPEIYKTTEMAYARDGAIAFVRDDDYELSLFWQHEDRYVSVVASGSAQQRTELAQTMETIVKNWQWQ